MNGNQTLMHQNQKVADCKFDKRGYLQEITTIYNEALMPIPVGKNPTLDLQRWLLARILSTGRRDIAPLREFYGGAAFQSAHGVSLFDTYWFANMHCRDWEQINAYDNWDCYSDSVFLMLASPSELMQINMDSPNLTIPGISPRIWYRSQDKLYLLYADAQEQVSNYKAFGQQSEYIAQRSYSILANHIYAKIEAYTSKEIEMLSLEDYYNAVRDPEKSNAQNLQYCCEHFHIPNWKTFFATMYEYDESCNNEERELSDIGILRDAKSLEIIGFAPL